MALKTAAQYSALLKAAIMANCASAADNADMDGLCDAIAGVLVAALGTDADIVFGNTVAAIQTTTAPGAPTAPPAVPVTLKLT